VASGTPATAIAEPTAMPAAAKIFNNKGWIECVGFICLPFCGFSAGQMPGYDRLYIRRGGRTAISRWQMQSTFKKNFALHKTNGIREFRNTGSVWSHKNICYSG
jgi:hypothetical protein